MVLTTSKILVLIAVLCAVAAFLVVALDAGATHPKLWPELIAASLGFGWASMLVP